MKSKFPARHTFGHDIAAIVDEAVKDITTTERSNEFSPLTIKSLPDMKWLRFNSGNGLRPRNKIYKSSLLGADSFYIESTRPAWADGNSVVDPTGLGFRLGRVVSLGLQRDGSPYVTDQDYEKDYDNAYDVVSLPDMPPVIFNTGYLAECENLQTEIYSDAGCVEHIVKFVGRQAVQPLTDDNCEVLVRALRNSCRTDISARFLDPVYDPSYGVHYVGYLYRQTNK